MHSTDSSMVDAELVSAAIGELSSLSLSSQIRARHALCGMIGTVCPATGTRLALLAVSHRRPPIVGWADGCQAPATSSVLV